MRLTRQDVTRTMEKIPAASTAVRSLAKATVLTVLTTGIAACGGESSSVVSDGGMDRRASDASVAADQTPDKHPNPDASQALPCRITSGAPLQCNTPVSAYVNEGDTVSFGDVPVTLDSVSTVAGVVTASVSLLREDCSVARTAVLPTGQDAQVSLDVFGVTMRLNNLGSVGNPDAGATQAANITIEKDCRNGTECASTAPPTTCDSTGFSGPLTLGEKYSYGQVVLRADSVSLSDNGSGPTLTGILVILKEDCSTFQTVELAVGQSVVVSVGLGVFEITLNSIDGAFVSGNTDGATISVSVRKVCDVPAPEASATRDAGRGPE